MIKYLQNFRLRDYLGDFFFILKRSSFVQQDSKVTFSKKKKIFRYREDL